MHNVIYRIYKIIPFNTNLQFHPSSLHNHQILRNLELGVSLTTHLLHLHSRSQLRQGKFTRLPINLENTLYTTKTVSFH